MLIYSTILIISIHASREGSDVIVAKTSDEAMNISIHASREGSDLTPASFRFSTMLNFNPRFPRGKRQMQLQKERQA